MSDDHDHDQHSAHSHLPSDPALRVKAIETLLVDKGLVDPATISAIVDTYQNKIGPRNGAKVVAKSWVDQTFRFGKEAVPASYPAAQYLNQHEKTLGENTNKANKKDITDGKSP